ncbi:uncharacterized protein G2W53_033291 [Senna tora]|uniref:Uncharacterized protein n=1 Tax=Senna tora TaxID=362788 RepID=A0A834W6W2_9FABA|nr:uncharacterized protein G2W53_033291 [Senna tora]
MGRTLLVLREGATAWERREGA